MLRDSISAKPKLKADKLVQNDQVDILVSRPGQHTEEEQVWVKGRVSHVMRLRDAFREESRITTQCRVQYVDPFSGEHAEANIDLTEK